MSQMGVFDRKESNVIAGASFDKSKYSVNQMLTVPLGALSIGQMKKKLGLSTKIR